MKGLRIALHLPGCLTILTVHCAIYSLQGPKLTFPPSLPIKLHMNERRVSPIRVGQEMTLMTLGSWGGTLTKASVLNCSGRMLQLRSTSLLERETPVKVEDDDVLVLGEVYRCEREDEDYRVGIRLSHMLHSLLDLDNCGNDLCLEEYGGMISTMRRS
jgi:hypothetical protein